jgi:hypothetical protein
MNDALDSLKARFPDGVTFLALGQTALWDEPTKAALRRRLDMVWPEARLVAAAHDTDYFAKLPGHAAAAADRPFAWVPHDDASTRGLWSAAGEMSRLFGSEDVPTQALLQQRGGVSLRRALLEAADPDALLAELTQAWGWTGIIHGGWEKRVAADIRLQEILPTLLEQVDWATQGSADCLQGERRAAAQGVAATIRGWITTFARDHETASLADLYVALFPRFYEMLLGAPPENFATSQTTQLLRFNRNTAQKPRFAFVDLFLDPTAAPAAARAYDLAVTGSGIYPLAEMGDGALPFDLVVPGRGRGTVRVPEPNRIVVDLPGAVTIDTDRPVTSVAALAAAVEAALGDEATLVGKAVTLLPMLAAEFAFVFHEGASAYSGRTRAMLESMARSGVALPPLYPILRVRYATWHALGAVRGDDAVLTLPAHLHQALGRERLSCDDLAQCWPRAVLWENERLNRLRQLRSPRALMEYLTTLPGGGSWDARARDYEAAAETLQALRVDAAALQAQVTALYAQVRGLRAELEAISRAKGDDFHARGGVLTDTDRSERAERFDRPIAEHVAHVRAALAQVRALKARRRAVELSPESVAARRTLRRVEAEAERARAHLAANALRTVNGLPHTDSRPSAWWFPLVDPTGAWFERLARTARYTLEELQPET